MMLGRSRSILLVFHRLQFGSHVGLLLLQQCLALFRLLHVRLLTRNETPTALAAVRRKGM
jgi:hypothetical protein